MSIISNVIRSAMRTKEDTLKCLTFCRENEKYLSLFSKCNCELYVIPKPNQSDWKTTVSELSQNIFAFKDERNAFSRPFFDCVIANDRLQEFDMATAISNSHHVPLVTIDHASQKVVQKLPCGSAVNVQSSLEGRGGNVNVCLSEDIKASWQSVSNPTWHGISITIPPHIKSEDIANSEKPRDGIIIDNNVPQAIMNTMELHLKEFNVAPRFPETSLEKLRGSKVYINTWNTVDIKTLEAMSVGCITVSHRTPDTELIIEDKKNGILFSDISELPDIIKKCKEGAYDDIPKNAMQTAAEVSIDEESFVKKWNQVLSYISDTFFVRN